MGGMSEPPRGWDPEKDSLEDLVHAMFRDDAKEPDAEASAAADAPRAAASRATSGERSRPSRTRRPVFGRLAPPVLATAALVTAGLAGGQILTATPPAPTPVAAPAAPTGLPTSVASPRTAAQAASPLPVVVDFGKRAELANGWRLAASRPYLCDVLMAVPVLQKDGTRIMRVTLTLTNRTGTPQPTRGWRLAATADGTPAELVEWPAALFRGVPDTTLRAGRSVRFLVAIRVPEHPVQVRITAERDAAPRAVLAGVL